MQLCEGMPNVGRRAACVMRGIRCSGGCDREACLLTPEQAHLHVQMLKVDESLRVYTPRRLLEPSSKDVPRRAAA